MMQKKRGQVWVETVVYTLIALVLIGAVLAFVKPKIEEYQDKAIIEQSMGILNEIDSRILDVVRGGQGNKRIIDVGIKKGNLIIDGETNEVSFFMESAYTYSQPGTNISVSGIEVYTKEIGRVKEITLRKDYDYDIKYNLENVKKNIAKSPTPYKISIYHAGINSDGKIIINVEVV